MNRIPDRTIGRCLALAVCSLVSSAVGDVIEMRDGRRFEGEIVAEDPSTVSIDTRVSSTIRTTLKLNRADVKGVERKPLPEGFYEPKPAPPRVSDPVAIASAN